MAKLPKVGSGSQQSTDSPIPSAPATSEPVSYSEDCPRYLSISDQNLEPIITLMRCPDATPSSNSDTVGAYHSARMWVRGGLDNSIVETPSQLKRAAYVHLCARQLREEHKPPPAMAIGCAWHADRLDPNGLAKEIATRPASHRSTIAKQAAEDVRAVREIALREFPKARAAREWEVFYDVPTRVRNEYIARRNANQKTYQQLVAFETAVQNGKFEGCAAPLRDSLTTYVRGASTMPALAARITDPLGYALTEALARCHYYNERTLQAGALLVLLDKARRQVTLVEQIYFAQLDALAADAEKAKKFPNLVGSKYSSMNPSDLRPVSSWTSKLDDSWQQQQRELLGFQTREGRVAKLEKTASGTVIQFQKERVPVVDVRCHETNRIDTITPEGKIRYREECTSTPKGHAWSSPPPIKVDDANGVKMGRFVRVGFEGDKGVVLSSGESPQATARLERVADLLLGAG